VVANESGVKLDRATTEINHQHVKVMSPVGQVALSQISTTRLLAKILLRTSPMILHQGALPLDPTRDRINPRSQIGSRSSACYEAILYSKTFSVTSYTRILILWNRQLIYY